MRNVPRHGWVAVKASGYTLVEVMVTLTIMVILGLLATPSLQSLNTKIRLQGVGSQFNSHLLRARSEAVSRNACTVMCLSTTTSAAITSNSSGALTAGPSCANSGSNWQQGWIVFFKDDCVENPAAPNNMPARPEDYIAVQAPIATDYHLDVKGSAATNRLFFNASGRPRTSTGSAVPAEFDLYYQTAGSTLTQRYGYNTCVDAFGRTRTISWNQTC